MKEEVNGQIERLEAYKAKMEQRAKDQVTGLIKELIVVRKNKGISQTDISMITGIAASNIARIESCKKIPTIQILTKYAHAIGMELEIGIKSNSEEM